MFKSSTGGLLMDAKKVLGEDSRFWSTAALLAILILTFWLRWVGMDWGLPQGEHLVASYRSDERTLLAWIRQMQPEKWDFNPHVYFNGTLLLFFLAGFYKILSLFGAVTLSSDPVFYYEQVAEWAKFFWFGRLLMVLIGVATVAMIYKAGRLAFGKGVGLLAALLYAIIPLHVVSSKHLLVEPAATLWFAFMLYFCFRIIQKGGWSDYLAAALILASACVVKATCAPLGILLVLSHFLGPRKKEGGKLGTSLSVAAGFYFIFNPYLLFNLKEAWQEARMWCGYYDTMRRFGYGILFSLTHLFPYGFGLGFALWGGTAVFFCCFSRRREIWLTLGGCLLFFYLNSRTGTSIVKYHVVLLPFLTILAAYFFKEVLEKTRPALRVLTGFLFVWMVYETLALSLSYNRLFLLPDARDRASHWIQEKVPRGAKVAVLQEPYWYSPPILYNQYFFSGRSRYWRVEPRYQVLNLRSQEKRIKTLRPDYVVVTTRELRLLQRNRGDLRKVHDWSELESFLDQEGYRKVQTFENRLEKQPVRIVPDFPPDDWQQILLEIRIYQK